MGWQDEAKQLRFYETDAEGKGFSVSVVAKIVSKRHPEDFKGLDAQQKYEKVKRYLRGTAEHKERNAERNKRAWTVRKVDKKEPTVVVQNFEPEVIKAKWKGNRVVRFALMGDTHINSKYTQLTYLHKFYDECAAQGITHIYHCGDIDEGDQMRMGHSYECTCQGADEHVDEIVRLYPKIEGITTHFITGNHDASITRRSGHDIGKAIAAKRPDMEYLGQDCAIVYLTPNCTLQLQHNWDGTAYAISYKIQKTVEALAGGEKPNILAIGHYHKLEYLFYRNVHCFQTGTFLAQTPYMRGKQIAAMMGGWILEINVDEKGYIQKIKQELIPYYVPIQDDWKAWK